MDSSLDDLMSDGEVATTHRGAPVRRAWLPLGLLAGLALVMAVGGWFATRPGGGPLVAPLAGAAPDPGAAAAAVTVSQREPATVRVPADLAGRDRHRVAAWLEAHGLVALTVPVTNPGDRRPGTVTDVAPTGTVEVGSTVRVEYVAPVAEPAAPPVSARERSPGADPAGGPARDSRESARTAAPDPGAQGTGDTPRDEPPPAPQAPRPTAPGQEPDAEPAPEPETCKGNGGGNGKGNGNGGGNGKGKGNC